MSLTKYYQIYYLSFRFRTYSVSSIPWSHSVCYLLSSQHSSEFHQCSLRSTLTPCLPCSCIQPPSQTNTHTRSPLANNSMNTSSAAHYRFQSGHVSPSLGFAPGSGRAGPPPRGQRSPANDSPTLTAAGETFSGAVCGDELMARLQAGVSRVDGGGAETPPIGEPAGRWGRAEDRGTRTGTTWWLPYIRQVGAAVESESFTLWWA